jgi:hypothetical protein
MIALQSGSVCNQKSFFKKIINERNKSLEVANLNIVLQIREVPSSGSRIG